MFRKCTQSIPRAAPQGTRAMGMDLSGSGSHAKGPWSAIRMLDSLHEEGHVGQRFLHWILILARRALERAGR